eukprot:PLAT5973.1.p1 GENE.PLAT5973.1~~PLAT5973.1.p1  ORF type:complete len:309 (-),score=119.76 PLAT5973.1:28-954(-)
MAARVFVAALLALLACATLSSALTAAEEIEARIASRTAAAEKLAVGQKLMPAFIYSNVEQCVICEYIVQVADRQINSLPKWSHAGSAFPTDPGAQSGYYRTYAGQTLLQLHSAVARRAKSRRSKSAASAAAGSGFMPTLAGRASVRARERAVSSGNVASARAAAARARRKVKGTDWVKLYEQDKLPKHNGMYTDREWDRDDRNSAKDGEFVRMYKDFMDVVDDTCDRDMPEAFQKYCNQLYQKSEKVVEFYLHDYDTAEICTRTGLCQSSFFDEPMGVPDPQAILDAGAGKGGGGKGGKGGGKGGGKF